VALFVGTSHKADRLLSFQVLFLKVKKKKGGGVMMVSSGFSFPSPLAKTHHRVVENKKDLSSHIVKEWPLRRAQQ